MACPRLQARPRRRQYGFTLVELLVALMLMALLSLMSWRGLDAMGRAQSQTQARANDLLALQSGLAQWGADLDAMASELTGTSATIGATIGATTALASPLEWNGQVLRITRYSGSAADSGLRVVAWSLGEDQGRAAWLRWQSPVLHTRAALQDAWQQAALWAQSPNAQSRARQVSIVPLAEWRIFYFRGGAWSNPGSSSEAAFLTPEGVRLQLTLPEGQPLVGKITRDWIRPTAVGAKT
jgi:general secretion pathway protein J